MIVNEDRIYTAVGFFVIGGLILLIFSGYYFYQNYLRQERETYVMVFKGSLQGLNTKSPITYRGVKIGEVTRVELTESRRKNSVEIIVYVQFFVEKNMGFHTNPIRLLIDNGYIADISKPDLLTGTSSIKLTRSNLKREMRTKFYKKYPIFPTIRVVEKYTTIDETLKSAQATLKAIKDFIESKELKEMVSSIDHMADNFENLADKLTQKIVPSMIYFNRGMEDISRAARSVQEFVDYLHRYPESLLRGRT